MNYPVWYLPSIGGGLLIAIIAIVHVCISHFAVGGGLYLVLAEKKARREQNANLLSFVRGHAKFFMLVSMVAGGMTGVAIWFVVSLVQPAAISQLIHIFVFAWAIEWVFFLIEIVAILIYFYMFDRLAPKTHLTIGWIYFAAGWLSLFVINGIIGFMLTPGNWLINHDFWSGFFNPSFWPSLLFRSALTALFAGTFAFVTSAWSKDSQVRNTMTVFSGKFVAWAILAGIPFAAWYIAVLPTPVQTLIAGASPTIKTMAPIGIVAAFILAISSVVLTIIRPALNSKPVALLLLASSFILMGTFEWIREAARRPYVINQVMYSNGVLETEVEKLKTVGLLPSTRWTNVHAANENNLSEAGQEIFINQCYACHTLGGRNHNLLPLTEKMSYSALFTYIKSIHEKRYFMPPFAGTDLEARALAVFITKDLHGKPITDEAPQTAGPGATLFENNCTACHDLALVQSEIKGWDLAKIRKGLDKLSSLNADMPDYAGTPEEKDAIANFLSGGEK